MMPHRIQCTAFLMISLTTRFCTTRQIVRKVFRGSGASFRNSYSTSSEYDTSSPQQHQGSNAKSSAAGGSGTTGKGRNKPPLSVTGVATSVADQLVAFLQSTHGKELACFALILQPGTDLGKDLLWAAQHFSFREQPLERDTPEFERLSSVQVQSSQFFSQVKAWLSSFFTHFDEVAEAGRAPKLTSLLNPERHRGLWADFFQKTPAGEAILAERGRSPEFNSGQLLFRRLCEWYLVGPRGAFGMKPLMQQQSSQLPGSCAFIDADGNPTTWMLHNRFYRPGLKIMLEQAGRAPEPSVRVHHEALRHLFHRTLMTFLRLAIDPRVEERIRVDRLQAVMEETEAGLARTTSTRGPPSSTVFTQQGSARAPPSSSMKSSPSPPRPDGLVSKKISSTAAVHKLKEQIQLEQEQEIRKELLTKEFLSESMEPGDERKHGTASFLGRREERRNFCAEVFHEFFWKIKPDASSTTTGTSRSRHVGAGAAPYNTNSSSSSLPRLLQDRVFLSDFLSTDELFKYGLSRGEKCVAQIFRDGSQDQGDLSLQSRCALALKVCGRGKESESYTEGQSMYVTFGTGFQAFDFAANYENGTTFADLELQAVGERRLPEHYIRRDIFTRFVLDLSETLQCLQLNNLRELGRSALEREIVSSSLDPKKQHRALVAVCGKIRDERQKITGKLGRKKTPQEALFSTKICVPCLVCIECRGVLTERDTRLTAVKELLCRAERESRWFEDTALLLELETLVAEPRSQAGEAGEAEQARARIKPEEGSSPPGDMIQEPGAAKMDEQEDGHDGHQNEEAFHASMDGLTRSFQKISLVSTGARSRASCSSSSSGRACSSSRESRLLDVLRDACVVRENTFCSSSREKIAQKRHVAAVFRDIVAEARREKATGRARASSCEDGIEQREDHDKPLAVPSGDLEKDDLIDEFLDAVGSDENKVIHVCLLFSARDGEQIKLWNEVVNELGGKNEFEGEAAGLGENDRRCGSGLSRSSLPQVTSRWSKSPHNKKRTLVRYPVTTRTYPDYV
ncbi:unnamed protein product [Amoebophrya sp. A120]|nr:unnamed protein product [Amoebophrya sp. A120]|eukprot:GSA120T00021932001.1